MKSWFAKAYWNSFVLSHVLRGAGIPYQPIEKTIAIQRRRVRSIVRYAYDHVVHYREAMDRLHLRPADIQTAADLERLPLLSKEELLDAPHRFAGAPHRGKGLLLKSSGTSGRARTIEYDPEALFLALAYGFRQRKILGTLVGRTSGYREVDLSRAGSLGSQLRGFYESHTWIPRPIDLRRRFISPGESFESILEALNEFRPDVIRGYGSLIGAFFRWAHNRGLTVTRPKAIHYGGDSMAAADRTLIEQQFGIPVYSTYQAAEALLIAFQCERRQGFHISIDQVAVRVIDAEGRDAAPGCSGEMVLSNLTNRATVLLNLKLGDLVTVGHACDCGRPLPVLDRIDGRADELVVLPNGSLLHPLSLLPPLQAVAGVVQIQVVQQELRRFELRVVCAAEADWDTARARLDDAFHVLLGPDLDLRIERVDRLTPHPGSKIRAVISHCRS